MNARHDTLLALTSSVPWPVQLHDVPPDPSPSPTLAALPSDELKAQDPLAPDQLPTVHEPPKSLAC